MSGAIKTAAKGIERIVAGVDESVTSDISGKSIGAVAGIMPDKKKDDLRRASESAEELAKRRAKERRRGTQTVLTSPLGSSSMATAIKKLGGSGGL